MERAEVLLLKLQEQYRRKESPAQMLVTLQLLQQEILQMGQQATSASGRSKVSVVLPFSKPAAVVEVPPPVEEEEKIVQVLQVDEEEVARELEQIKQAAELKNEISMKLRPSFQDQYDPLEEVPTLASHLPPPPVVQAEPPAPEHAAYFPPAATQAPVTATAANPAPVPARPVVEFMEPATPAKDLNEKLKEAIVKEVAHKLVDTPIKDLRKAIGINDRYLFINELFNGDEAMFERSVKTLNQFSILPEAEFWMQRELRIKLGWKEDNALVHQFVQLVRRRFS